MAGLKKPPVSGGKSGGSKFYNASVKYFKKGYRELYSLMTDPSRCYIVAIALIIAEVCVNLLIIEKVLSRWFIFN